MPLPRHAALALILSLAGLLACGAAPVGQKCDLGATSAADTVVIASGSVDCSSRLCLGTLAGAAAASGRSLGLCTATCEADADCEAAEGSPCTAGFACAPVTAVGEHACERLCVCRDAIDPGAIASCQAGAGAALLPSGS